VDAGGARAGREAASLCETHRRPDGLTTLEVSSLHNPRTEPVEIPKSDATQRDRVIAAVVADAKEDFLARLPRF
jgi:hypothetical protein